MSQYAGTRGHKQKIYRKGFRLNIRGNYFSNRGIINLWNELPENVVMAPTLIKIKIKKPYLTSLIILSF